MKIKHWLLTLMLAVTITNYPNPFNPKAGEITTIECTPDTSVDAKLYIYDMAARLIHSQVFNLTANIANRSSWNGYSDTNQKQGNGVYLFQIISSGNSRIGKGKIWIMNQ